MRSRPGAGANRRTPRLVQRLQIIREKNSATNRESFPNLLWLLTVRLV